MRRSLLLRLFVVFLFHGMISELSLGATSNWVGPGSDFNTATNWDSGVPNDIAAFGTATPMSISLSTPTSLNGLTFLPGASAYTITVPTSNNPPYSIILSIAGTGIVNQSGNTQTIHNTGGTTSFDSSATAGNLQIVNVTTSLFGTTTFNQYATAGNATITNQNFGLTYFNNNSTAGNATIINTGPSSDAGETSFHNQSTAGNAFITNTNYGFTTFVDSSTAGSATIQSDSGGAVNFMDASSAGTAVITNNNGGVATFSDNADASSATVINNAGGTVIIAYASTGTTIGSLSGAGAVNLGYATPEALTIGSLNQNMNISGSISLLGSLVKIGTGTLTLSGQNTFASGTNGASPDITINGGVLQATTYGAIPMGSAVTLGNVAGATLQLTNTGPTSTEQILSSLSGGGSTGGNVVLGSNTTLVVGTNSSLGPSNLSSTFAGAISGSGSLLKTGTGTLTLTGSNTYTGTTEINGGTLLASAYHSLSSASAVVLDNVNGAVLQLGYSQVVGSISGGGTTGGSINVNGWVLNVGADNTSTTYAGTIYGAASPNGETLNKIGTGTLTLSGENSYTGETSVQGGTLDLTGSLAGGADVQLGTLNVTGYIAGNVFVFNGGILSGTGSVGAITNSSLVSPGVNGVGTLTAASYTSSSVFGPGALNINFNGAPTNLLRVTGNANLTGGILNLLGTTFTTGTYAVLTAGSVTGTFATVNAPGTTFLTFSTQYNPTDVDVTVTHLGFATAAQTGNQQTVAAALDSSGANGNASFTTVTNALLQLNEAQAQAAFSQISGDALASFHDVGLRNAAAFNNQMLDHGTPDNSAATAGLAMPVQLADAGDVGNLGAVNSGKPQDPNGIWARGIGLFDKANGDSSLGSPGSTADTGGFQVGYDYALTDEVLLGVSRGLCADVLKRG